MAQPPDITETFVREVDENLRRDQLRDFTRKYASWIVAAVVLFLVAAGGFIYWQDWQRKKNEQAVEQLAQVFTDISKGQTQTAPARLDKLSDAHAKAVRAAAQFGRAAVAINQNDTKLAIAKFKALAGDSSMPKPFRDLALIRQTAFEYDTLKPEAVIARMKPMVDAKDPTSSWFASAAELSATAHYQLGQFDQAGALYGRIAKAPGVAKSLQSRAVQMAGMLGVDAVADRATDSANADTKGAAPSVASDQKGSAAPKAAAAEKAEEAK